MIPTSKAYEAIFEHTRPGGPDAGTTYITGLPVEAWSDEGEPLVLPQPHGTHLVAARTLDGFVRVRPASHQPVVGVLPGGAWSFVGEDDEGEWAAPVLGWAVTATGDAYPLHVDAIEGMADVWHEDGVHLRRMSLPARSITGEEVRQK